jgi:hypothetical protein
MKWFSFFIVLFFIVLVSNQRFLRVDPLSNESNTEISILLACDDFQAAPVFLFSSQKATPLTSFPLSLSKEVKNNNIKHTIIEDPNDLTNFLPKPWHIG